MVSTPGSSRLSRARATVDGLANAALAHDQTAFTALTSARDPSFPDRARLLSTNLVALPLVRLRLRLDPTEYPVSTARRAVLGAAAWVQSARVEWRLAGDSGPAEQTVWLTFVDDGAVRLAGTIDVPPDQPPEPQPSWWLGPVQARTIGRATAVVGAGQSADHWAQAGDRAAHRVRRLLPAPAGAAWNGRVVVEIPATSRDFEAVLGATSGSHSGIAAVAQPEGPDGMAAIRVVVNPRASALLSTGELDRVLDHEITHVATRAAASPAPTWAEEGLAEWVSLRDRRGARSWGTDKLLTRVRAYGAPHALPDDAAFAADADDLDAVYAEAWLACRLIADRYSPARLSRFSVELDRGRSVDQASRRVLGPSAAELTAAWRRYLTRLARAG